MKRMLLLAVTSSLLALAVPGVASAHHRHGGRHHASSHKRHAKRARLVTFGTLSPTPGPTTPSAPSEPAGKVASFEGGVLKITLADGSTVSGKVTEQTRLECTSANQTPTTDGDNDQGGGDDPAGRESGEHGGPWTAHASDHQDGQQGDQQGDQGDDENQAPCTTAALTPNAVVTAAELELTGAGAVWEKVELLQ